MTPLSEYEGAGRVAERVNALEDVLIAGVEHDERLSSSEAAPSEGNVLDFIKMTGLTGPSPRTASMRARNDAREQTPQGPPAAVSFETAVAPKRAAPSAEFASDSLRGLNEIIAELSDTEGLAERTPEDIAEFEPVIRLEEDLSEEIVVEEPEFGMPPHAIEEDEDFYPEPAAIGDDPIDPSSAYPGADSPRVPVPVPLHADDKADSLPRHEEAVYDPKHVSPVKGQGRRKKRRLASMRIVQWTIQLAMISVVVGAVYYAYQFYANRTADPRATFTRGTELIGDRRYQEASTTFRAFAQRFPDSALKADAQFMAAYALQLDRDPATNRSQQAFSDAIILFDQFIEENPGHHKVARAETLKGLLLHKVGRNRECISLLEDPSRRLKDPTAYLPALRTLARAYAAEQQIDNARSAYLRAASLEGNIAPDEDYLELAALYERLTGSASSDAERRRYQALAIEQWDYALRVPGLLKSRKGDIKVLRDVIAGQLERYTPPETESAVAGELDTQRD